jgi:type III secretory pathway component EscU
VIKRLRAFFSDPFVRAILKKAIIGMVLGFIIMMWLSAISYLMMCSAGQQWVAWDWWLFAAMQILSLTTGAFLGFFVEIMS